MELDQIRETEEKPRKWPQSVYDITKSDLDTVEYLVLIQDQVYEGSSHYRTTISITAHYDEESLRKWLAETDKKTYKVFKVKPVKVVKQVILSLE